MEDAHRTLTTGKRKASPVPWSDIDAAQSKSPKGSLPACICGCNAEALAQGLRRTRPEFLEIPARKASAPTSDDKAMAELLFTRLVEEGSKQRATVPKALQKNLDKIKGGTGGKIHVHRSHFAEEFWCPGRQQGSAMKVDREKVYNQCLRGAHKDTGVLITRAEVVERLQGRGSARGQRAAARAPGPDPVSELQAEVAKLKLELEGKDCEISRLKSQARAPAWGMHMLTTRKAVHALTPFPGPKSLNAFIALLKVDGFLQSIRLYADTGYDCRVKHYVKEKDRDRMNVQRRTTVRSCRGGGDDGGDEPDEDDNSGGAES